MDRTPAKGAAVGSRRRFPMLPMRPEQATSLSLRANTRRERSDINMIGRGDTPLVQEPPRGDISAPLPLTLGGES